MKVLFLDFDGVINSREWMMRRRNKKPFDPDAVERVNRIVDETGASVVVSSTWRLDRSVEQLRRLLRDYGFAGDVIGKTSENRVSHPQRGDAILSWLEGQEVGEYVVLDDDGDMDRVPDERFIQTDFATGLQDEHVERAIKVLEVTG